MSDNPDLEDYFHQLHQTLHQKNQIITHLTNRITNQQQQIDMLVMDSEQKHYHEITKYYTKTYQKYMKYGKYLLLKIEDNQANGIYLPKCAKIVHFGELDVYRGVGVGGDGGSSGNVNQGGNVNEKGNNNQNRNQRSESVDAKSLKQLNLNKQQSNSFQTSCKGLSLQIQELKQKLKAYTTMVTQKSASKIDKSRQKQEQINENAKNPPSVQKFRLSQYSSNKNLGLDISRKKSIQEKSQSLVKQPTQQQLPKKNQQKSQQLQSEEADTSIVRPQKNIQLDISSFPSPSPKKKKIKSTTIYFRKR